MNALFALRRMGLWMVLAAAPAVALAVAPAGSTYKVQSLSLIHISEPTRPY